MKGCLSLIIKTIIAILVFFGLKYLGIVDFVYDKINEHQNNVQEQNNIAEDDVVDLSQISEEYTIDKNLKILKNKMILAQHEASGQKMIIIEPYKGTILSKSDVNSENLQNKLDSILSKYKNQILKIEKIEITKHGEFEGIGQTIPYAKITAGVANLPLKDMEGIVGVAELKNGKNVIIVSANEKNKYSQIIAEEFFSKVKEREN